MKSLAIGRYWYDPLNQVIGHFHNTPLNGDVTRCISIYGVVVSNMFQAHARLIQMTKFQDGF